MTSQEIQAALMKLASDLVCGKLLPEIDTDHWYASTPLAERRQICKAMEDAHERHKVLALKVRDLHTALARRVTLLAAQPVERSAHPTAGKPNE